jgi:hypothetical protein
MTHPPDTIAARKHKKRVIGYLLMFQPFPSMFIFRKAREKRLLGGAWAGLAISGCFSVALKVPWCGAVVNSRAAILPRGKGRKAGYAEDGRTDTKNR